MKPVRLIRFGIDQHGRQGMEVRIFPTIPPEAFLAPDLISEAAVRPVIEASAPKGGTAHERELLSFLQLCRLIQLTEPPPVPAGASYVREQAMSRAINLMASELPKRIEFDRAAHARAVREGRTPFVPLVHVEALETLLEAVTKALPSFLPPAQRRTRIAPWHDAARALAFSGQSLWVPKKVGIGRKPTSPIVKLVAALLPLLGAGNHEPDAIVKAISRPGKRKENPG